MSHKITVANGDGIGPEIMEATLNLLQAAKAKLEYDFIEIGEQVYKSGHTSGMSPDSWDSIMKNKIMLKAPITTPQGKGYKSLNVTLRKTLGLYANIRPVRSFHPFVQTKYPVMDTVIVRENEEDLYAGIEHRQTNEVYQCLKLISRPGCEKIVRYAFEYAKQTGRKKVTCMSKDNIMKLTDGLFHSVFDELAKEYPDIENEHWIIDIGSAKLAAQPEMFDVIVTPNLYGDIISDIAAEISGSVGLGGSSNIGEECAMFEAIHGSAPQIAGQGIANPSGLILASCQMLQHLNEVETAELIENAWIKTIEDGVATADFYDASVSTSKLKTQEFAKEIINRLGEKPKTLSPRVFSKKTRKAFVPNSHPRQDRKLDGVDIFLYDDERVPDLVGDRLNGAAEGHALNLKMITNRGVKVYPDGNPHTFCTDHWRCRFLPDEGGQIQHEQIWSLLNDLSKNGLEVIKTELLYSFDGERGYSLGQGQ